MELKITLVTSREEE
jgi:hypothetical protein